jgi:RHS repeat-associated protein
MVYDGENRMTSYTKPGTSVQYFYDGDGHRVKKIDASVTPTATTVFVYNVSGQLIAEYMTGTPPGGGTSYLTSDHLGSARVVMKSDGTTTTTTRHDFLPSGEEIQAGIGGRTAGQGYVADTVRQKFTQKERDSESGLDYFGARYYSSPQGRFTSSDPLLSSGTVYDPQTWNRYSYTRNNPLKYVDPFGLYVFDRNATDDEKKKFRQGLKDLEKSRNSFKKGSEEYKRIDRSLNAYGKEGDKNGVTIIFGPTKDGAPAATSVGINAPAGVKMTTADNPTGQDTRVTIDPNQTKTADDYVTSVGHEGSHVADGSDLVGALPTDLTSAAAQAILDGPLNLTKYVTETRAYEAESFVVQGLRKGTLTVGPGRYEIWNAGWSEAERAVKRSAGIDKVLAYPKSQGGLYEVTPTNQGKKLIE